MNRDVADKKKGNGEKKRKRKKGTHYPNSKHLVEANQN
jgi:hypothetical protein